MNQIDVIIPTFNLPEYLIPCVQSILKNGDIENLHQIIIVNNGTPESLGYLSPDPKIKVLQQEKNLGWEGGLKMGLGVSEMPFVVFMNDDTFIPRSSRNWLTQMLKNFDNPLVGAVGPTSNCVMGSQNMGFYLDSELIETPFLIGFCKMLRREALYRAGDVDDSLPNHGDDIDLSIRLRNAGYTLLVDRSVFVFHHGFKTGERVHPGYWNSMEMQDRTNHSLIRKHGLRKFLDTFQWPQFKGYVHGLY